MDAVVDRQALKNASKARRRQIVGRVLMLAGVVIVAIGGLTFWLTGGRYVSTDDAYVQQDKVTIVPEVTARIVEVGVVEPDLLHQAVGQDGSGEVRVAEVAATQVEAREVGPRQHGAGSARPGAPQPIVLGADQVELGLVELAVGRSWLGCGGHFA